jgi:fructokinase
MILCCGEALIDMLPRGLPGNGQAFLPVAGGAIFNTALAIARLGAPVGLFTGLSSDFFGDILRDRLAGGGVDLSYAVTADRPTTLAFVRLTGGQARYAFYDENTAGRMLTEADLPALSPDVKALFFGGISLIGEPCGLTYEAQMVREASERVTMLDPNVRPDFVTDEQGYRRRLERMIGLADIVKISDEDLSWLGGAGDSEAAAVALLSRGPKVVILTRGAAGAIGLTERDRVAVVPKPTTVVDTVGAGDTFNAGMLTVFHERGLLSKGAIATLNEADLRAALELGSAAASVSVSRAGSDPPWRRELDAV